MADVDAKVHEYFSRFPQRIYPKGQILIFADESPDCVFYLLKGKVRKYDISPRGDEIVVNIFKPPAFFPMSWVISHQQNKFFYKTEVETIVHVVPSEEALEFLKANPDVMLDLLNRIYRGMEGLFGKLVRLMSGTARDRLLYELVIESRRFGKPTQSNGITITITENDLAARTGLTRETVSREMSKLHTQGLVAIRSKEVFIKDVAVLERTVTDED